MNSRLTAIVQFEAVIRIILALGNIFRSSGSTFRGRFLLLPSLNARCGVIPRCHDGNHLLLCSIAEFDEIT